MNAAVALCAAEVLVHDHLFSISDVAFREGLRDARWPGRMEVISENPTIILDGAHNAAGSTALADSLTSVSRRRLFVVVGVMRDKDIISILGPLLPLADKVFAVEPALDRALASAELAAFCHKQGKDAVDAGDVAHGVDLARLEAEREDVIVVCGSLFTVGQARAHLVNRPCRQIRA